MKHGLLDKPRFRKHKCGNQLVKEEASIYLDPLQVGVGMKNGADAVIHSVQRLVAENQHKKDYGMLKVDFSNAFNILAREKMILEVKENFPILSPWIEFCYGNQPLLFFGDMVIKSCEGVQQGDPLGPLLFALTIQPLIQKIHRECPELDLNCFY